MSAYRTPIIALSLSAAALVGLMAHEGYSDKAIIPVPGDVPTIGFGSTTGVKLGDTITPPKAVARALQDAQHYEGALKQCLTVPLHQHEYDAFLSLAYNIGPAAFCRSTLVKKANAGDYAGACGEILRYRFYQGHDCKLAQYRRLCGGLWTRRQAEYQQCSADPNLTELP